LAFLFPATTQVYYNAFLEPFFDVYTRQLTALKESLPIPAIASLLVLGDVAIASGFGIYSTALLLTSLTKPISSSIPQHYS